MTGWARLVDQSGNPQLVAEDELMIGRAKGTVCVILFSQCTISLIANRLVSARHCKIYKDKDGKVWLADCSTNGTLVNNHKVTRGQKVQLSSGDVIKVVFKRDDDENNVVYRFEDLRDDDPTLEMTQKYDDDDDDTVITTADVPTKDIDSTDNSAKDHADADEPPNKVTRLSHDSEDKPVFSKGSSVMEQSLQCGICQEILHKCISLQPCMHSFCASCYSSWMERSRNCPHCRGKVHRVSKNHIVNNLVDAYLKAHPEKKRSDDELREMDARNKITEDMLYPKRKQHESDNEYDSEESSDENGDENSDENSDGSYGSGGDHPSAAVASLTYTGFGHPSSLRPPPPMKCRQCPGYSDPPLVSVSVPSSATCPDSSTTASSVASDHCVITPPPYTCPVPAVHILCHCCMQPMPNHATSGPSSTAMPKQKCDICCQAYCHLYWGCRSPNCRGCLGSLSDINLADHHLNGILNNGNQYESDILKDYLKAKGLGVRDLLQICAARLDSGEYHCSGDAVQSDTTICYRCCLKKFQEVVFCYRKDIPVEDLPAEVVSRPDCYWGRNCRTQYNKPHHARHFNHICEQTRF